VFGERADGEFPMPGMADFAHNDHLERTLKNVRHLSRDDDPAARQAGHKIHFDRQVLQSEAKLAARVLARFKYH
jgi:hypothetical protein